MDLLEAITPILENANIYPLAENAVVLDIEQAADTPIDDIITNPLSSKSAESSVSKLNNQQKIWWLCEQLNKSYTQHSGLIDIVPGMNNLTLIFNPLASYPSSDSPATQRPSALAFWTQVLEDSWRQVDKLNPQTLDSFCNANGKLFELPVVYGGEAGPDIDFVAQHTGLSCEQVIAAHSAVEYTVYFIGFQPGFAYLQGMNPLLITPRKATPLLSVTPGSVAIGGNQTGIYPLASPGGWQIIGQLSAPVDSTSASHQLFDINQPTPSLFKAGDRIRFVAAND